MSFLEWIKEKISKDNRKFVKIEGKDIDKIYGASDKYECVVYTEDKTLLKNAEVIFEINGKEYKKITNSEGVASLNINLNCGMYIITATYHGDNNYTDARTSNLIKVSPKITAFNLIKHYLDDTPFKVKATDINDKPLPNILVIFIINGVTYQKNTDNDGVASLNINLTPNIYDIEILSYELKGTYSVTVLTAETRMEGTDIKKTVSEKLAYKCAVYDMKNNRLNSGTVTIEVNGVTYTKEIKDGFASLNINLKEGDYKIKATYIGDGLYRPSIVTNTCSITSDKKTSSKHGYHYNSGCGRLGQCTAYDCGPHALMQSYYNLTGIDVSEKTLMEICGTTTSGTGHSGLETGLAWLNRKYGTNISIEWKNFSDLGWDGLKKILDSNDTTMFWHELYRNQWGHYSLADKIYSDILNVLNSLGSRCNYPAYCGYQELRSKSTQESYWKGISQKSIAILKNKG